MTIQNTFFLEVKQIREWEGPMTTMSCPEVEIIARSVEEDKVVLHYPKKDVRDSKVRVGDKLAVMVTLEVVSSGH